MDAAVQMIRNAMCCIKDLRLFQDTILWDPTYTLQFYEFPAPLNKTTPLEFLISMSQLYACISCCKSGVYLMVSSLGKLRRIERIVSSLPSQHHTKVEGKDKDDATSTTKKTTTLAYRLVHASLMKEGHAAARSVLVGMLVFCIGLSFFWLFANSLHVTETDWIGGLQGLIHALTVMEICLVPLLYYMYMDGTEQLAKASRLGGVAESIRKTRRLTLEDIGLGVWQVMTQWSPFWDAGARFLEPSLTIPEEQKLVAQEVAKVDESLQKLLGPEQADDAKAKKEDDKKDEDDDDKNEKARLQKLQEHAEELLIQARITRMEGYREFLYMVLNSIAFYGYMVGIVVYYWQQEDKQPLWMRKYLLGNFTNNDADWYGNFAGDLMWTVEPIVILSSPMFLNSLRRRKAPVSTTTPTITTKPKTE